MIEIEFINKKIGVLYLNRPEKLNAMNGKNIYAHSRRTLYVM